MKVDFRIKNNILLVVLLGELDENACGYVREKIDKQIENTNFLSVVFDLENVSFIDSMGLGLLIGRYKKLQKKGVSGYIGKTSQVVDRLFRLSGIYSIFAKLDPQKV